MIRKGPNGSNRKMRVERSLHSKCFPEIVPSMGDEENSGLTSKIVNELQAKALKDFKSSSSDTYRGDRKQKVARKKTVKEKHTQKEAA